MSSIEKSNENYLKIENFIDKIKEKINSGELGNEISKSLSILMNAISKVNPFNSILFDIYSEASKFKEDFKKIDDPMKKGMIMMKLDFWKEKLRNSVDIIEL